MEEGEKRERVRQGRVEWRREGREGESEELKKGEWEKEGVRVGRKGERG